MNFPLHARVIAISNPCILAFDLTQKTRKMRISRVGTKMLYRHTKRYQALLQLALQVARQQPGYNLALFLKDANLSEIKHDTIDRFKRADLTVYLTGDFEELDIVNLDGKFLRCDIARKLWNFCDRNEYIEKALTIARIRKSSFFSTREAANAAHCILNANMRKQVRSAQDGLKGGFWCYRVSFKYPGFIVKSRVRIDIVHGEYFDYNETQRTTGKYQSSGAKYIETTNGFGIIKSRRFWIFATEGISEQPRIFCFFKEISESFDEKRQIFGYCGHVMEGTQFWQDNFYSVYILLVSEKYDERIWREEQNGSKAMYDIDEHHDIFPLGERFGAKTEWPNAHQCLPQKFLRYVILGIGDF